MRLTPAYRICVICSGNICRSPMGEVILRSMLQSAGLHDGVVVDSAGTGGCTRVTPRTRARFARCGITGMTARATAPGSSGRSGSASET